MNKITKILALAFMAVASMACNKVDDSQGNGPEPLEVNTNNISGKWELVEWNGAPMAEGTYVYMDIERALDKPHLACMLGNHWANNLAPGVW